MCIRDRCSQANCVKATPMYKQVLEEIFNGPPTILGQEGAAGGDSATGLDVERVTTHVKGTVKPLVDYLENNHTKLKEVGPRIEKIVGSTANPQSQLIGLLVIDELLANIDKFKYDENFLKKMISQNSAEPARDTLAQSLAAEVKAQNTMESIIVFENSVLEVLLCVLVQENKYRVELFPYAINTLQRFSKKSQSPIDLGMYKVERILSCVAELYNVTRQTELDEAYLITRENIFDAFVEIIRKVKSHNAMQNLLGDLFKMSFSLLDEQTQRAGKVSEALRRQLEKATNLAIQVVETVVNAFIEASQLRKALEVLLDHFDSFEWRLGPHILVIIKRVIASVKSCNIPGQSDVSVLETLILIDQMRYSNHGGTSVRLVKLLRDLLDLSLIHI
eukprot:TRINITY_DN10677_c0_g1_i1.p1 TRINITY_DN10677_c0_g1~~TRINITY_DN10677_c0_g1_i1.p1  ORF type:complete len:391 (-),score=61.43 TRINITY_DN10677_c0_g1_i1:4-1176(-)